MRVAAFINSGTSTSFQLELSVKIGEITPATVTVFSFYDTSVVDMDADVTENDVNIQFLGASSRFDYSAYRQLRKQLRNYDILHTHYNFVGSAGRLVTLGTTTKIVNTEHTDHSRLSALQNAVNVPTYPMIDVMVANSQSTENSYHRYERALLRGTDCRVIHNGVDFDRLHAGTERTDLPELPTGPRIVTAARLVPVKNIENLVRAMQSVLADVPDAELVLIGDGPEEAALRRTAAELGLTESVTFLGRLEREAVYGTIAQCDVFAVPSLYEGFCNAAVEAMGLGVPVVASNIDVLHEVVGDGGLYANPHAPDEIADQLLTLLTNQQYREEVGEIARERARSEFTIEKTAERYYEVYRSLMEEDVN